MKFRKGEHTMQVWLNDYTIKSTDREENNESKNQELTNPLRIFRLFGLPLDWT